MKKITISSLAVLLTCVLLISCSGNHSKQIAKTWMVTNIETTTDIQDSVKTSMLQNSQMVFTKDGSYTTAGGIGADQGTFTIDKDGKNLSTISNAGKGNSVYSIEKLSDDQLVLSNNGNTVTCTAKK